MPSCMVIGCLSGSGREQYKYGTSPLPQTLDLRTKWLKKINRPDNQFGGRARVCHKHFQKDDFLQNPSGARGRVLKRTYLKPSAIPSMYLSNYTEEMLYDVQTGKEFKNLVNIESHKHTASCYASKWSKDNTNPCPIFNEKKELQMVDHLA